MSFQTFIRNPVLALMINLAMVVTGLFAYRSLGVDAMPSVSVPTITITTRLDGAGPEVVESQITRPVEDAVAVLGGVDTITSKSLQGGSEVQIQFKLDKDANVALQECRDKVDGIREKFPAGTENAQYEKYSSASGSAIKLAVSGQRSIRELSDLVEHTVRDRLQSVSGVASVEVSGARSREVQIWLESDKLAAYQVPVAAVSQAVADQNVSVPGGMVRSRWAEYILVADSQVSKVADFGNLVVADVATQDSKSDPNSSTPVRYATIPVRVNDVGSVVDGMQEVNSLARLNGNPSLVLGIRKSFDANLVAMADGVAQETTALRKILPSDVHIDVIRDDSVPIRKSIDDLEQHLVIGSILASLTVLIFMGSIRLTFIAAIAIPVSLVTTFALMKSLGYTLNYMTLLALTLGVGLVIDDAVVVLENIWRIMLEKGLSPVEASIQGIQEIGFAVLATTMSLIVLFLPLSFMPGIVGRYFAPYGVTMAFCIFVSMVVSFTLTPMLCAVMLRAPVGGSEKKGCVSMLNHVLETIYVGILKICLRVRFLVIILCGVCLVWTGHLLNDVGKEFLASDDEAQYSLEATFPKGWPLSRSGEALKPLEADLRKLRGVVDVITTVASDDNTKADIAIQMVPYEKRVGYTQNDSIADARKVLKKYPLFQSALGGGGDFAVTIQGPELTVLESTAQKMIARLGATKGFVDLRSDLDPTVPEVRVVIDRERAADLKVNLKDASNALALMVGGSKVGTFVENNIECPVRLRMVAQERDRPDVLASLYLPCNGDKRRLVPLASVANVTTGLGPSTVNRLNRQRAVTLRGSLEKSLPLESALNEIRKVFGSLNLSAEYQIVDQGSGKIMQEAAVNLLWALLLAVVFMYMVLASQFANLLDPFIILLTLPLTAPFAIFSLVAAGMTLNLFSALGLFLLFGVVKKNAILQIDLTNELVRGGMEPRQAILQANRDRLRPILMTTITLVVAMLPVALAGPTGAMRAPMAMVVVGGQTLSLLLTLVVVPVALSYVQDFQAIRHWTIWARLGRLFGRRREA